MFLYLTVLFVILIIIFARSYSRISNRDNAGPGLHLPRVQLVARTTTSRRLSEGNVIQDGKHVKEVSSVENNITKKINDAGKDIDKGILLLECTTEDEDDKFVAAEDSDVSIQQAVANKTSSKDKDNQEHILEALQYFGQKSPGIPQPKPNTTNIYNLILQETLKECSSTTKDNISSINKNKIEVEKPKRPIKKENSEGKADFNSLQTILDIVIREDSSKNID
ncbi:uncharacterized protein LOC107269385 [Cephus cinctus]|uniref:Uncharacterized protein LOC107269385 n=1 Tax=Cephus cinctus TaxID=211228 RepID=A0AAJ7FM55_CEPCN|nr:uncharacterized protein LOC107269385 [Cephus cinctus]